jgi:hypothetical protein
VVQQVKGENQCLDGTLNSYRDKCLDIIKTLEAFHISHIPREENKIANGLAQQAFEYEIRKGLFIVEERLTIMSDKSVDEMVRPTMQSDLRGTSAMGEHKTVEEKQTRLAMHDSNVNVGVPE